MLWLFLPIPYPFPRLCNRLLQVVESGFEGLISENGYCFELKLKKHSKGLPGYRESFFAVNVTFGTQRVVFWIL